MYNRHFVDFPAPAKLNLFLHITGQRANGYHELETIFQFLDYGDTLSIAIDDSGEIELLTPIKDVDNADNLIIKAAKLLQQKTQCQQGASITINKILPMGGGLGGGSSNAATILVALNALWKTQLSTEDLATIGLSLGADVPIFIHGFSAFAQGVGEILTPVQPKEYWYLVSKPLCSISTQAVFTSKDLPRNTPTLDLATLELETCHNDCQTMVIKNYPKVANLLAWLVEYAPSRMTGTGACIFTRFNSQQEALALQDKLPLGIESFVAQGINQSPLLDSVNKILNK